jgi:hypothetical protein
MSSVPVIPITHRALQIPHQGGYEVLQIHEIPVPQLKAGEILIKTEWAGVSFLFHFIVYEAVLHGEDFLNIHHM